MIALLWPLPVVFQVLLLLTFWVSNSVFSLRPLADYVMIHYIVLLLLAVVLLANSLTHLVPLTIMQSSWLAHQPPPAPHRSHGDPQCGLTNVPLDHNIHPRRHSPVRSSPSSPSRSISCALGRFSKISRFRTPFLSHTMLRGPLPAVSP